MNILVVGGTGPTGPAIVNGLLQRGHDVTILHTGVHEVTFDEPVQHIHADPHFAQSLSAALQGRRFDLVVGMYGRLSHVIESFAGKTERFIGVGAMFYEGWIDNVNHADPALSERLSAEYDPSFVPVPTPESFPRRALEGDKFSQKGIAAEDRMMELHSAGVWQAVFLRYPAIYGPRQHAPGPWPIILRVMEGRPVVVPDAGLLMQTRAFTETAAAHVLGAVDNFDMAAGEAFNVSDDQVLSLRAWITEIASALDRPVRLVSVPLFAAGPSFEYSKGPFTLGHRQADTAKARRLLALKPFPDARDCLQQTVSWHLENVPPAADLEAIRARWDIQAEDALTVAVQRFHNELEQVPMRAFRHRHTYLHPTEQSGAKNTSS